jgi:hypothetical protein
MNARAGGAQRALAGLVPLTALLFLLTISTFGCEPARAGGVSVPSWSAREAGAFWSPARMRQARPLEVRPSTRGSGRRSRDAKVRLRSLGQSLPDFGANFEPVADPTEPQFRVNGAVFLALPPFGYARCSGTAVRSGNESVVITAGHCIHSGGRTGSWFPGHWVFVPAYRYGQRPYGVFPARWIDTTRQWRASGSENFDVGAAVVGPNAAGETLEEAVGGDRIAFGLKPRQTFEVHGYPAEEPFDGETQRLCRDMPFLGHDPDSFLEPGPLNLAVSCEVNGGASGGGWTIRGDTLNSVTNYGYGDAHSPDFGAYFGKEVARLYHRAEER